MSPGDTGAGAEDRLFAALTEAAPDLTEAICQACERRIEVYRLWRDEGEGHRLRATIRVIIDHFAASRGSTQLAHDLEDIGALRATQGLPVEAIPTAWLIISDQVWEWVVSQTAHEPAVDLSRLWTQFQRYVNESAGAIQDSYVRTRSEAHAAEVMVARATLDRLLRATSPQEAEQQLQQMGHHAPTLRLLLCQHRDPKLDLITDEDAGFKRMLSGLAAQAGRSIVPWTVWHGIPFLILPPDLALRQVTDELARASGDLRAVVSGPIPSRTLIREQLVRTVPLLDLANSGHPVVEAEALTLLQMAAAKSTVTVEEMPVWLRDFFESDHEHERKWTETVQAMVAANLNIAEAAKALFVHQNTIYYRLDAIKKTCGVDIREPAALADVQFALQLQACDHRWRGAVADPLDD